MAESSQGHQTVVTRINERKWQLSDCTGDDSRWVGKVVMDYIRKSGFNRDCWKKKREMEKLHKGNKKTK